MATRAHSSLEPTQHGVSRASSMHRKSIDESAVSKVFSRNMSQSSLKNFVDIDRLIGEIKIAPRQHQQQTQSIQLIWKGLEGLRKHTKIVDQIRTIELLLESIQKKLLPTEPTRSQSVHESTAKKGSNYKEDALPTTSPIKQLDDLNSRIVYTNFSLKEASGHKQSTVEPTLQTPIKNFNTFGDQSTDEVTKLNSEIKALERMLKMKGVSQPADDVRKSTGGKGTHSKKFQSSHGMGSKENDWPESLPRRKKWMDVPTLTATPANLFNEVGMPRRRRESGLR